MIRNLEKRVKECFEALKFVDDKSIIFGDIYNNLNNNLKVNYPIVNISHEDFNINFSNKTIEGTLNIFYVDRETDDRKNCINIQDAASRYLYDGCKLLMKNNLLYAQQVKFIPFEEKFASECAGGYVTVKITDRIANCMPYEEQEN